MMEENNRKGPGIFYAVMGVATLVVAIIGATFAFFSAQATTEYTDDITGQTNADLAAALKLKVERVNKTVDKATSIDLVPTDIDGTNEASVSAAVAAKCEANGYTGCHLYRITATTEQTVSNANLYLDNLTVTGATKVANWKYTIYRGTDTSATSIVNNASLNTTAPYDMHNNAQLTQGTPEVYYLLVYLQNVNSSQNQGENSETGTYNGSVTLKALGGEVAATFSA